jgi:hypothetical protein
MLIDREVEWSSKYLVPAVWGNNAVGTTDFVKWSNYTTGDPAKDIETGKVLIEKTTGFTPNTLVVTRDVHAALKFHPMVKDQYKHTSSDSITPSMLAKVFEIERYMVCGGIKNSGQEEGADSFDFVQSNKALLVYSAPSPSLRRPSGGYTFAWTGYMGAPYAAPSIERFDMREIKATRIEGEMAYVHKLVAPDMGYLMSAVV